MARLDVHTDPRPLIVHVIHHLLIGGMENGLVNLINHLPAAQFRHAVLCIEDYSDFRDRIADPSVEVVALHRSRIGAAAVRRQVFAHCRRLRPALVHTRNLSGLDALVPAWLAGVPRRIHSEHGWDVGNLHGSQWKPALLRRLHRPLVSHYITVSQDLQRFLVERIGVGARRITQIYNGVDTAKFAPPTDPNADHTAAFPEDFRGPQRLRFGAVGRLQPVKDHASLLHAFAAMRQRSSALREQARLAVLGGGPLLGELRELARSLDIEASVWLPGPSDQVAEFLRGLDVFVLPSLNEGISNTVLEAMASGLPVLASAVGGNVELVQPGKTGALFAPGDRAALAELMARCANDPPWRSGLGAAARQRAVAEFSLDSMMARYQAVYSSGTKR